MFEQMSEPASERLFASPGGYEMAGDGGIGLDPERGAITPLASGVASLPPRGSIPTPLTQLSGKARGKFANFRRFMLVAGDLLDAAEISKTRVYEGLSLKQPRLRLKFAADLLGVRHASDVLSQGRLGVCVLCLRSARTLSRSASPSRLEACAAYWSWSFRLMCCRAAS